LSDSVGRFYDEENSYIAKSVLEKLHVDPACIEAGIQFRPLFRFQQMGNIIFDVAHNPDGCKRLLEAMEIHFPTVSFSVLVGMSKNKNMEAMLDFLAQK